MDALSRILTSIIWQQGWLTEHKRHRFVDLQWLATEWLSLHFFLPSFIADMYAINRLWKDHCTKVCTRILAKIEFIFHPSAYEAWEESIRQCEIAWHRSWGVGHNMAALLKEK